MKRPLILVTGGAGYIGRVLVGKLVFYGARVRVVDTLYFPTPAQFPLGVEVIVGDITNLRVSWFEGVAGVCHLAGFSNDPTADADPERNFKVNTEGTWAVGGAANHLGIERFTYASSASIYDLPHAAYTNMATERRAVEPVGHYSVSKYEGEEYLLRRGVKATIFRQATVFGNSPRMRFDLVVNTMMRSALTTGEILVHGGGRNHRPLISVENVAMAHVHSMLDRYPKEPGLYNLVDFNMTVRQIAEEVREGVRLATGTNVRIVDVPYPEGLRVRDYQISGAKYGPPNDLSTSLRYHVQTMASQWVGKDMYKPEYSNIEWMKRVAA
jgi:nucleoside-diphosphate-sugar epimerase